jgi:superoxide dismutase, Fe-Mn family
MKNLLGALPYAKEAIAPVMSKEVFDYHCGMHHLAYVINLNKLNKGTEYERLSLEAIIKNAPAGDICNAATLVWNHSFFWHCMQPKGSEIPNGALADAINEKWGSFDEFKKAFQTSTASNFGSSWTWLVKKADGSVEIVNMGSAGTPLTTDSKALLGIDVWEHAYYNDHRKMRPKFVDTFLNKLVNWDFAGQNFA